MRRRFHVDVLETNERLTADHKPSPQHLNTTLLLLKKDGRVEKAAAEETRAKPKRCAIITLAEHRQIGPCKQGEKKRTLNTAKATLEKAMQRLPVSLEICDFSC